MKSARRSPTRPFTNIAWRAVERSLKTRCFWTTGRRTFARLKRLAFTQSSSRIRTRCCHDCEPDAGSLVALERDPGPGREKDKEGGFRTMKSFQHLPKCLLACFVAPLGLFSAILPKPVVGYAVADVYHPAQFDQEKIGGLLGDRMRINLEGRLLHVDEKGIIEGFQNRPGKQDWIGEHAGKFLDAAANAWEYTHDPRLKALMDRVAHELIATQKDDGYLGTYTDDKRWTSWDVWV